MFALKLVSLRGLDQNHTIKRLQVFCDGRSLEILENHAPFIGMLDPGEVSFTDEMGKEHAFVVEKGLVHVLKNAVTILINKAVSAENIDPKEARIMSDALKKQLGEKKDKQESLDEIRQKIRFLEEQIKVAQRLTDESLGE